MNFEKKHILLKDLEVYKLARELSKIGWEIYQNLSWQDKKIMGDQFITATDSFGANISEGYSRYHYLEKIKFFYNARASLTEAVNHWLELLKERGKIKEKDYIIYNKTSNQASLKLQNFISAIYKVKNNHIK
jgi:four helix bundle protein